MVGLTGIAELTGKGNPAVVANWRTRLSGFPPARIADKHPKFDLVEVLEWYRDQGPRSSEFTPITMRKVWPLLVSGFQANASVPSPRSSMVALVLLQSLLHNGTDTGSHRWAQLVDQALAYESSSDLAAQTEAAGPDLARSIVGAATEVEQSDERASGLLVEQLTFEGADVGYAADLIDALDQLADVPHVEVLWPVMRLDPDRTRSLRATGQRLSRLMLAVADVPPGGSVLDPACGEGELLLECHDVVGGSIELLGQELDAAAWCVARSQMLILGVDADLGEKVADSLREPLHAGHRVDAVMVDPPLGADAPALDRWIEFGLGQLKPGGRVVVALPLNELVPVKSARRSPDRRMMMAVTSLAQAGLIEGVLITPPRLRGDVVGPIGVFSFSRSAGERTDRTDRSVTVVQLIADPSGLMKSGVVVDVAEQFHRGGFAGAFFESPLHAMSAHPSELLDLIKALVAGVGSRDWSRRSSSEWAAVTDAIELPIELDALSSEPRSSEPRSSAARRSSPPPSFSSAPMWRPLATPSAPPTVVPALAPPEPVRPSVRRDDVHLAAARLLDALERERYDMPDDVWRRIEPNVELLRRFVDDR